jgi:hypothetical protein
MGLPLDPTNQTCGAAQLGRCVRVVPGDAACSELDGGAFFLALLTRTKEADPAGQRRLPGIPTHSRLRYREFPLTHAHQG